MEYMNGSHTKNSYAVIKTRENLVIGVKPEINIDFNNPMSELITVSYRIRVVAKKGSNIANVGYLAENTFPKTKFYNLGPSRASSLVMMNLPYVPLDWDEYIKIITEDSPLNIGIQVIEEITGGDIDPDTRLEFLTFTKNKLIKALKSVPSSKKMKESFLKAMKMPPPKPDHLKLIH